MSGLLILENVTDHITKITINRPKAMNALNSDLFKELDASLNYLATLHKKPEKKIRTLIISGAGDKAFVAGADIKEFNEMTETDLENYIDLGLRVMEKIDKFPVPVVAEVGGYCLGGGMELALACDFILASDNAKFGLPEVTLGLLPGFGGTRRLLRRVTVSKAKKIVMLGDMLESGEALDIGLVDAVFAKEDLSKEVLEFSKKLSQRAPLAVQSIKNSLSKSANEEYQRDITVETQEFHSLFFTQDAIEGRTAFIENRKPTFRGN